MKRSKKEIAMDIRILDQTFAAVLEDSETARAFSALLPMKLHMTELNGNEKYHDLMGPLPAAPRRVGHVDAGDIMLFGDRCVVLFYQSFDTPYSYTPLGRIAEPEGLAALLGEGAALVCFE